MCIAYHENCITFKVGFQNLFSLTVSSKLNQTLSTLENVFPYTSQLPQRISLLEKIKFKMLLSLYELR